MDEKKSTSKNDGALGLTFEAASQIGERLRWAREQRHLTQEHMALKTKIRERYIIAIEAGEWGSLPTGLNGRGLVRLYAKEVGVFISEFDSPKAEGTQTDSPFESAPVITTISRNSPVKKERTSPKNFREKASQTTNASPIITPNISEVLGIPLSTTMVPRSASPTVPVVGVEEYMARLEMPKTEPVQRDLGTKTNWNATTAAAPAEESTSVDTPPMTAASAVTHNVKRKETRSKTPHTLKNVLPFLKKGGIAAGLGVVLAVGSLVIYKQYQKSQMGLSAQPIEIVAKKTPPVVEKPRLAAALPIAMPAAKPIATPMSAPLPVAAPAEEAPLVDRLARIEILEPVRLVIESDDKTIFSGYHDEGSLEVLFKRDAKIQVSDGSKVKLIYGGWDHGELGTSARKRKIVLNAKSYQE